MTADPVAGLVYLPLGNATPDYWIAKRRPFDDKFGTSITALDIATGNPRLADRNGFQFSFHGATGVVIPVEIGCVRGRETEGTLGIFKSGACYDTSNNNDVLEDAAGSSFTLTGLPPRRHTGRTSVYVMADQAVATREVARAPRQDIRCREPRDRPLRR